MHFGIRSYIERGVRVLEDGEILIDWDPSYCYEGCREIYTVRIERLPPNTEMNGSR